MPSRPEVEFTDAIDIALDVTDGSYRQTNVAYTDHAVGYYFFMQKKAGTSTLMMYKTLDGGSTFPIETGLLDTAGSNLAEPVIWADWWTPNTAGTGFNVGTEIHQMWFNVGAGDGYHTYIDTADDSWRVGADSGLHTETAMVNILRFQGKTGRPSMVKSSNGDMWTTAGDDDVLTTTMLWRSTDNGDTWAYWPDSSTAPFPDSLDDDDVMMLPMGDNHLMFIWWDVSAEAIYYRVLDCDTPSWDNSPTLIGSLGDYNAAHLTGAIQSACYDALWLPNDAHGSERVILTISVNASSAAVGNDIDCWEYAVGTDTWTQKTQVEVADGNDNLAEPRVAYDTATGDIYCAYWKTAALGGLYNLKWRKSTDGGTSWTAENSYPNTVDHMSSLRPSKYFDSGAGTWTVMYGNEDTNRWYSANLDVFYPIPITADFATALYSGADIAAWTQFVDGPGSKGLEYMNGGIGYRWQDGDVGNRTTGMDLNTPWSPQTDVTGKLALVEIDALTPAAIQSKAAGGLVCRLIDADGDWAEWYLAGSDTLEAGAQTLLFSPGGTPDATFGTFDQTTVEDIRFWSKTEFVDQRNDPAWVFKSITFGSQIIVAGGTIGTPLNYEDIRQWSEFFTLGLVLRSGNLFQVLAKLRFGDDAGNHDTYFQDSNKIVNFPYAGVPAGFYVLDAVGHASTTTDVRHGVYSGGVAQSGCVFDSAPDRFANQDKLTLLVNDTNVDHFGLYACKLLEMADVSFTDAAVMEVANTQFDTVEAVNISQWPMSVFEGNKVFGDGTNEGIVMNIDTETVVFTGADVYGSQYGIVDRGSGDHDTFRLVGTQFGANTYDFGNDTATQVYLEVTAGADTPTVFDFTPSVTSVTNNAAVTLTNLPDGTEVRILDAGTETEITGIESTTGGTYQDSVDRGTYTAIDIVVHHLDYVHLKIKNIDVSSGDVSIPVSLFTDRQYDNP